MIAPIHTYRLQGQERERERDAVIRLFWASYVFLSILEGPGTKSYPQLRCWILRSSITLFQVLSQSNTCRAAQMVRNTLHDRFSTEAFMASQLSPPAAPALAPPHPACETRTAKPHLSRTCFALAPAAADMSGQGGGPASARWREPQAKQKQRRSHIDDRIS